MTKLFVPFCSAQDGESTDMNCLVFWAHCENGKNSMKHQVYNNKGIFTNFEYFSEYEILISLECTVDSEWNDTIDFVVSRSVVELFIHRSHKNQAFNALTLHETTPLQLCLQQIIHVNVLCCDAWNSFETLDFMLKQNFCTWLKKCWSTSDSTCAYTQSTKLGA